MEEALTVYKTQKNGNKIVTTDGVKYNNQGQSIGKRQLVRYADDFVVFCTTKEDAEKTVEILAEWLQARGLSFSKEKTRIVHISEGFNFLGFNVRQYKVTNTKTGWKLLIKPSADKIRETKKKLKDVWLEYKGKDVKAVIRKLNPIIRGIANYLRPMVSSRAFNSLDHHMYQREKRYAQRMHPEKSTEWRKRRYWGKINLDKEYIWVYGDKSTGSYLLKFSWFTIQRHTLIKGNASPDDGKLKEYWKERKKEESKTLIPSYQKVAIRQKCICPVCSESIFNEEELHLHHIKPRKEGGKSNYSNLQLLHLYCHQQIHSQLECENIQEQEEFVTIA